MTICGDRGYLLGIHYGFEVADHKGERRFERAERRRGVAVPIFNSYGQITEPTWKGVAGRRGFFWTLWNPGASLATSMTDPAGQSEADLVWVGRNDWY